MGHAARCKVATSGLSQVRWYNGHMVTLRDILTVLRQAAPEESAMAGDPVGLTINFGMETPVQSVGICLDITLQGAELAAKSGVQLVVAHHPLLYSPLKKVDLTEDPIARVAVSLITSRIALYTAHTNWDRAPGGINDTLAALLGLQNVKPLGDSRDADIARIGDLPTPLHWPEFHKNVRDALAGDSRNALRFNTVDTDKIVRRVAVCGGAGAGFLKEAIHARADAFVTSDVRHHEFVESSALGMALLDAGHSATESPGMRTLQNIIAQHFPDVNTIWVN